MADISTAIAEAARGDFDLYDAASAVRRALRDLWGPEPRVLYSVESDVRFSLRREQPLAWAIAFTPHFRKSVADMDKKLQGRILTALSEISDSPNAARGDTIKPLVGTQKGLWRYRVGDFRLVYEPRETDHLVVLLEFGARGGIYE